jgi:dTDP-4-amino-4,6-dideoxygalactose transaminase
MNEFQAAMGLCVLYDINRILDGRKRVWEYYKQKLSSQLQLQKWNPDATQNYHYFPVIFESEAQLKTVEKKLLEQGVRPRRYFYPSLNGLNFIKVEDNCLMTKKISKHILCLPMFESLSNKEQKKICDLIQQETGL